MNMIDGGDPDHTWWTLAQREVSTFFRDHDVRVGRTIARGWFRMPTAEFSRNICRNILVVFEGFSTVVMAYD
jgi:hypothetical protein